MATISVQLDLAQGEKIHSTLLISQMRDGPEGPVVELLVTGGDNVEVKIFNSGRIHASFCKNST